MFWKKNHHVSQGNNGNDEEVKALYEKFNYAKRRLVLNSKLSLQTKIKAVEMLDDIIHWCLKQKSSSEIRKLQKEARIFVNKVGNMEEGTMNKIVRSKVRNISFVFEIEKNL